MSKQQKVYLTISIFVIITGFFLSVEYRPYVYANKINDFGFADTIGSLISVIGFCFFSWSFKNYPDEEKNKHIIITTLFYGFIWEFFGYIGIYGTFDWKDIIGAIISGIFAFLIKELVKKIN